MSTVEPGFKEFKARANPELDTNLYISWLFMDHEI